MPAKQDSGKPESQEKQGRERPRVFRVDVDRIAEELKNWAGVGVDKDTLTAMFADLEETFDTVRDGRTNVVMVRVSRDSLDRLDELVDCGLARSRSEAAAFLIAEGSQARRILFEKLAEQARVIRQAKERLRELLKDEELPRKADDATVIIADAKQAH